MSCRVASLEFSDTHTGMAVHGMTSGIIVEWGANGANDLVCLG
ncbi:MAG TPA: hypothetical protein VK458_06385 [Myxococcaceae bacterium]|nr:hypothetical protein [Myxococcaceae bacterium]